MQVLANAGKHDLAQERWNAYGQFTHISSWKAPFSAAYSNLNGSHHSLSPNSEYSFTSTATLFLGLALWPGAEAYFVPEVISSRPLSGLVGLGASIQNFELQKQGSLTPSAYVSRLYLAQTINLGGSRIERASGPMQLGTTFDSRRLVFVVGNYSILDFFDRNSVVGDPRRQFFSIAFLAHGAYDFAADSRGYTWGALFEFHYDDWALRAGRFTPPKEPNQLALDFAWANTTPTKWSWSTPTAPSESPGSCACSAIETAKIWAALPTRSAPFRPTLRKTRPLAAASTTDRRTRLRRTFAGSASRA